MIFADELPTSLVVPEQAVTIVIVFGCLLFFLNVACAIIVIFNFNKRRPPIESEFATKAELAKVDERFQASLSQMAEHNAELSSAIFAKLDTLTTSMNNIFRQIERDLGKLEGHK